MQAFLNWNFRLYRAFGIDVRIHWTLPVFVFFEILNWGRAGDASYGAYLMLGLVTGTLIHEYGHCMAARMMGAGADAIVLWPLGGLAMVGHSHTNRGDMFIAFAGPAFGILVCGFCLGIAGLTNASFDWDTFNPLVWGGNLWIDLVKLNLIVNLFNLLTPVYPFDGGRILTGLLTPRFGYTRALLTTTFLGILYSVLLIGAGLYGSEAYPVLLGVWILFTCINMRMQLKMGGVPDYAGSPYGDSFDAGRDERPARLGFFARWKMKREAKRRARQKEDERRMREEVDVILDKVKREGMAALSPKERAALNEASKRIRDSEG